MTKIFIDRAAIRSLANHRDARRAVDDVTDRIARKAETRARSSRVDASIDTAPARAEGSNTVGAVGMGGGPAFFSHLLEFGGGYHAAQAPLRGGAADLGLRVT